MLKILHSSEYSFWFLHVIQHLHVKFSTCKTIITVFFWQIPLMKRKKKAFCSPASFIPPTSSPSLTFILALTQGPPLALTVPLEWLSISRIISSWGLVISCCGPGGAVGGWAVKGQAALASVSATKGSSFGAGRSPHPFYRALPPPPLTPSPPCQLVASSNTQPLQAVCDWALTLWPLRV